MSRYLLKVCHIFKKTILYPNAACWLVITALQSHFCAAKDFVDYIRTAVYPVQSRIGHISFSTSAAWNLNTSLDTRLICLASNLLCIANFIFQTGFSNLFFKWLNTFL